MAVPTELLEWMEHKGVLDKLFQEGIISYKIYMMLPIRRKIDSLMRSGNSHGEAVKHVASELHMSRQNIYNYL